jgi:hypothetical protein
MILSDEEYIKFIKDGQKFALEILREYFENDDGGNGMKEETELEYYKRMRDELPKYPTPFLSHAIAYVNLRIYRLENGKQ